MMRYCTRATKLEGVGVGKGLGRRPATYLGLPLGVELLQRLEPKFGHTLQMMYR